MANAATGIAQLCMFWRYCHDRKEHFQQSPAGELQAFQDPFLNLVVFRLFLEIALSTVSVLGHRCAYGGSSTQ